MHSDRAFGKTLAWVGICWSVVCALSGCDRNHAETEHWPNKPGPKVVVSFAPLYCFAVNVAGDDAHVKNVMTTTGPHDFNPTEQDARLLSQADIMFVIGLGLDEHIAQKMKDGSGNTRLRIVELAARIPSHKLCEGVCTHAHHKDDPDHKHDLDPHVWLSPEHAIYLVQAIRDELKSADPDRAANYDRRAAEYIAKLEKLKADGLALLAGKTNNRLVSFHDSLTYFANCFQLEIRGVLTQNPVKNPMNGK
ncbi:MAG: metal ABC transporter substrate-binding protein [Gemmataceae bacterium]|nr:metal ABC transporter substrate-binding protein [Gemmata sp.]MDW8196182.1 metal ABC transporter substrate-binding protein [Gemmataceae bacterium]